MNRSHLIRVAVATGSVLAMLCWAAPAQAAEPAGTQRLTTILGNATGWLMGIAATVATLFLTIGAVRYMLAGGDPGEIEKAKAAFRSAVLGYALTALAPVVVAIVKGILGIG